jgi:hypothetical protein
VITVTKTREVSIGEIMTAVFNVRPDEVDPLGARLANELRELTKVTAEQVAVNRELTSTNAGLRLVNEDLRQALSQKAATEIQEWVDSARASEILGYTEATIRRMCRVGDLEGIKPKGNAKQAKWRVWMPSVERYRAAHVPRRPRRAAP